MSLKVKFFLILLLAIYFVRCQKVEDRKTESESSIQKIDVVGVPSFGKVAVGVNMTTRIRFINTSSSIKSVQTVFEQDMSKASTDILCTWPDIPPNHSCLFKFDFEPTIKGVFNHTYAFDGEIVRINSEAILPALILPTPSIDVNLGVITAGNVSNTSVNISNSGEQATEFTITLPSYATVTSTSCNLLIQPNSVCTINLRFAPQLKTTTVADQVIVQTSNQSVTGSISGSVLASSPYGNIEYEIGTPNSVSASASWVTINTQPIRDAYGNLIEDNTPIYLFYSEFEARTTGGTPIPSGSIIYPVSGVAVFEIRAPPALASAVTGEIRLVSTPSTGVKFIDAIP